MNELNTSLKCVLRYGTARKIPHNKKSTVAYPTHAWDSLGICNLSEPFDSNMEALTDSTTFILPRDVGLQCCHLNKITIFGQN